MNMPPPPVSDEEIERWCQLIEHQEATRTFAREDLAPGTPRARRLQIVLLEIVRRLRAGMAA